MQSRYSDTITDHFMEPRNGGRLQHPSGTGLSGTPGQGPYFLLQIISDRTHIQNASFQCHNCGVTVACGSMLTELIKQKSLQECNEITPQQLSDALDGVPPDKMHMVTFVIEALRLALGEASK